MARTLKKWLEISSKSILRLMNFLLLLRIRRNALSKLEVWVLGNSSLAFAEVEFAVNRLRGKFFLT